MSKFYSVHSESWTFPQTKSGRDTAMTIWSLWTSHGMDVIITENTESIKVEYCSLYAHEIDEDDFCKYGEARKE